MSKRKFKEYLFSNTITITEETAVTAESYEEAEDIFLAGGGDTEEVDSNGGDWECIGNPDEWEEEEDE
tara:strand:- start:1244 stop:1447 length:204 start_codon:yes stop_codon:yes gene_type:complete